MKLSTRLTVIMVALVVLTATAVGVIVHRNIESRALPRVLDRIDLHARVLATELDASVRGARGDVTTQGRNFAGLVAALAAGGTHPIDGTPASHWLAQLQARFIAELDAKPHYIQMRLIGIADGGRELVRVNRTGPEGAARAVPDHELQRRADRDYFKATTRLKPREVYAAPIEFDAESGLHETVEVPTLRVAAPVEGVDGRPFGVLVVDIDMRPAFARLRASALPDASLYVVNANGDYLVHPDPRREFRFASGAPSRVQDEFPEFSLLPAKSDTTPRVLRNRDGATFGVGWETVSLAGGSRVTVMEAIPYARLLATGTAVPSLLGALLVLLGAVPLAMLLARSLSRPLAQMTEAMHRFRRGERITLPRGGGSEIESLTAVFDRLTQDIREKTAALEREVEEHRCISERARLFDAAVESSDDAIIITTLDGTIGAWNRGAEHMFGYSAQEAVGRSIDIIIPSDRRHEMDAIMRTRATGTAIRHFETVRRRKDGSEVAVSVSISPVRAPSGELVGGVGIIRDISESKSAQEALQDSERLARGIIENALDGIIQVDDSGHVIEWNPQAEAILGWTRQEAVGRSITSLYLPPGSIPRYIDMNRRLASGARMVADRFEFDALRKDGNTIKVEVSMTGVRRRGGNVYNLFVRDITRQQAAEAQLRQAQKMEAVGQLTGGIAHAFNNMLTVITGTIELLADAVADKPQLAAIAKLISEAADRGAELTAHLLAFARKHPLQPRETDINTLIADSARLLRPAVGESVEIELRLREGVWPALVDANQLTTALLNLAVNARDAMPGGGKLTLETRNVVLDENSLAGVADVAPGNYVLIAISDTGHGIPKELRDKVFEPFFSTKEPGKGTGLGLSMVYGFVKQSGGHIQVYSEFGHGTTFRMYLPQAGASAQASPQQERVVALGGTETILVVEDDAMVRGSVITQLESLGYRTIPAATATEALALVEGGATFDLLFTDVILSGSMNGRRLSEEVERRRPGTRVLYTSGYTEDAIIHHGRLDPGVLLLAKPYRKAELARMLRVALETPPRPSSDAPPPRRLQRA